MSSVHGSVGIGMVPSAAPISIGDVKIFINDLSAFDAVLLSLEGSAAERSPFDLGSLAKSAKTLIDIAAGFCFDHHFRGIRDVIYYLRRVFGASELRFSKDVNAAYSLVRHMSET